MNTTLGRQTNLHARCQRAQACRPLVGSVPAKTRARHSQRLNSQAASSEQEVKNAVSQGKISQKEVDEARAAGEEIYIGFDKSDTGPRAGRKGRMVKDDPSRYPNRDPYTGGWAGGELGLRKFVEEQQGENSGKAKASGKKGEIPEPQPGSPPRASPLDPGVYPGKEDVGPIPAITGGFAGGEKGVQQFVKEGEIKLAETGKPEFSPIVVAALIAGGVTTGAILLNSGIVVSEEALQEVQAGLNGVAGSTASAAKDASGATFVIDDQTRQLLNIALGITGVSTLLIGGRIFAKRIQESSSRLKEDSLNIAKISVFWLLVLIAALFILDSS